MSLLTEKLLTLDMLLDAVPILKLRMVKHWLQMNPGRFRERCVVKIGKKLFFDLDAIERWMLDNKGEGVSTARKSSK